MGHKWAARIRWAFGLTRNSDCVSRFNVQRSGSTMNEPPFQDHNRAVPCAQLLPPPLLLFRNLDFRLVPQTARPFDSSRPRQRTSALVIVLYDHGIHPLPVIHPEPLSPFSLCFEGVSLCSSSKSRFRSLRLYTIKAPLVGQG